MFISDLLNKVKQSKAVSAGIGYTIGNILIKGVAFLSVPIFTRLMSPEDFGIYSVFISYEAIFMMLVGLCLHSSIKSADIEFKGHIDDVVSSIFVLTCISASIFAFLFFLFNDFISSTLKLDSSLLYLLLLNAFASSVLMVYSNRLSLDFSYKKYLGISFFTSAGNILVSICLILTVFKDIPYMGRIYGTVIPVFIASTVILMVAFYKSRPNLNLKYLKFTFIYSLPIIPHGLSQVALSQFGRIMIQNMVGNAETGLYSFAYTLALIPQVMATSLDTAWSPWFFKEFSSKKYDSIENKSLGYVIFFSVFSIAFAAISPELIKIMAPKIYWESAKIVIPAIIGVYFTFLYYLPACVEYYEKKTYFIALGTVISGFLNIALTYVFIKQWGYVSAAYATLLVYILNYFIHCFISKKITDIYPYNLRKISVIAFETLLLALVTQFLVVYPLYRYIIFILYLIFMYFTNKTMLKTLIE